MMITLIVPFTSLYLMSQTTAYNKSDGKLMLPRKQKNRRGKRFMETTCNVEGYG
jgi:hypothetical protein